MKNIFIILLLSLSVGAIGQYKIPAEHRSSKDHLKKSKHQQTAATILLIACPVLVLTPLIIGSGIKDGGDATAGIVYSTMAAGFLALPVSIGFFIASSANKKKALRLSFKNETVHFLTKQSFTNRAIPSLSLKINL